MLFTHIPPEHIAILTWRPLHEGLGSHNTHMVPFAVLILRGLLDTQTQLRFIKTVRICSTTILWIPTNCLALIRSPSRAELTSPRSLPSGMQSIEIPHVGVEVETVAVPQPGNERWQCGDPCSSDRWSGCIQVPLSLGTPSSRQTWT